MFENYATLWSRIARSAPDRMAIVAGQQRLSYAQFDGLSSRLAGALLNRGVKAGDRVAFYLHNTAEYLVAFNAALKIEAIPVTLNYRYRAQELEALLEACSPSAFIFAGGSADVVADIAHWGSKKPLLIKVADLNESAKVNGAGGPSADLSRRDVLDFHALVAEEPSDAISLREPSKDAELYIFTGGTTGTPKAVVWGIGELLHIQQAAMYEPLGIGYPQDLSEALRIATSPHTADITTLPLAPFIHATALFSAMNTLALGGTVVINPSPSLDPNAVAEMIVSEKVTRLIVAGDAVAIPVLDALEPRLRDTSSSLGSVISSGMRFSDDTKRRFHRLGRILIVDILASTEGGPYATAVSTSEDDLPARFRLSKDAVVLDLDQQPVQDRPGATGILAYRGALPKGYLNDPAKTEETYPVIDGVRHASPGDYVRVGENRYIDLLGRGSSVINTGGEKVYPGEVEEVLLRYPGVNDAVVFGVPDQRWGERVTAMVAVDPGADVSEDQLAEHVGKYLAGYKKPRTLAIRPSLQRGGSGKLDMRRLKGEMTAEQGMP